MGKRGPSIYVVGYRIDIVLLTFVLGLILYVGLQNYVPERTVEVIKYLLTEKL